MKKIILILILSSTISIFNSCKKDSSGNPIIPGITTSMTAKINGTIWNSIVRTCSKTGNTINLSGTSLDGQIIQVMISPDGTANLATNVNYTLSITTLYKTSVNVGIDDIYFAITGTVKLTQLDIANKLVSGTFSFNSTSTNLGTAVITNGEFTNISFVEV